MEKLLVFDYDGTIHDTLRIYEPAFCKCVEHLQNAGFLDEVCISSEKMCKWLGMNAKDMWLDFQPGFSEELREMGSAYIGKYMEKQVLEHKARWYEGAEETLDILKQMGYKMIILSNSKKRGGEVHFKEFKMNRWFEKWYDCESFDWKPKSEIIKEIQTIYNKEIIVIGDRKSDIDAASTIKAVSIGCLYGYGGEEELKNATYIINSVKDIPNVIYRNIK